MRRSPRRSGNGKCRTALAARRKTHETALGACKFDLADNRTDLADNRTDLADNRTDLAEVNNRTDSKTALAACKRTSVQSVQDKMGATMRMGVAKTRSPMRTILSPRVAMSCRSVSRHANSARFMATCFCSFTFWSLAWMWTQLSRILKVYTCMSATIALLDGQRTSVMYHGS